MVNLMIIVGTILIVLSFVGLLAVGFGLVKQDFITLLKGEKNAVNDTVEKKKNVAAARLKKLFLVTLFLGFVILAFGLFLKYTPRGEDSFFSENVDGVSVGDGDIISLNEEDKDQNNLEEYADNSNLDTNNTDDSVYIVIEGKDISFGNTDFKDLEDFSVYFSSFDSLNKKIYLVDKYAVSKMYHDVREMLEDLGIEYEEIAE